MWTLQKLILFPQDPSAKFAVTAKLVDMLFEMADKKYRAAVERFEYIFEQIDDLMYMEHHHLAEMNEDVVVSVAEFLDNAGDDDLEIDEDGGLTSKHMKSLESLKDIVKNWLSFDSILPDMTLNLARSVCLKNYVNMVSNLILLSKKLESILVSRLNT